MDLIGIGKAIKSARVMRGLNQTDAAELAGISVSYLSLVERGKRDPTITTLIHIADALGISLHLLFYMADTSAIHGLPDDLKGRLSVMVIDSIMNRSN